MVDFQGSLKKWAASLLKDTSIKTIAQGKKRLEAILGHEKDRKNNRGKYRLLGQMN